MQQLYLKKEGHGSAGPTCNSIVGPSCWWWNKSAGGWQIGVGIAYTHIGGIRKHKKWHKLGIHYMHLDGIV